MLTDEKTIRDQNLQSLRLAKRQLSNRAESANSCFESALSLNKASLTMCLAPELDEDDVAALCELLMLQSCLIQAAYSYWLLRGEPIKG